MNFKFIELADTLRIRTALDGPNGISMPGHREGNSVLVVLFVDVGVEAYGVVVDPVGIGTIVVFAGVAVLVIVTIVTGAVHQRSSLIFGKLWWKATRSLCSA